MEDERKKLKEQKRRAFFWEIKRDLSTPITKHELDREEKRSVFFLGLLAVMVTLRVSAKDADKFTFLGIEYNLIPFLNVLIYDG